MKRRLLTVAFSVVFALASFAALAGCSQSSESTVNSDFAGTWGFYSVDSDGSVVTVDDIQDVLDSGYGDSLGISDASEFAYLDLNSDGTAELIMLGESLFDSTTVTWEAGEDSVTLSAEGETVVLAYDSSDDTLTYSDDDQILTFQKQ